MSESTCKALLKVTVVSFLLALLALPAVADRLSDDTMSSSTSGITVLGQGQVAGVSGTAPPGTFFFGAKAVTYVNFDALTAPPQAKLVKAEIVIYVNTVLATGSFDVVSLQDTWNERSLTANNAPRLGAVVISGVQVTQTGFIRLDVTSAYLAGVADNGFALVANAATPNIAFFIDTKENLLTSHAADLDVLYSGPPGPQGPEGKQGPQGIQGPPGPTGYNQIQNNGFNLPQRTTLNAGGALIASDLGGVTQLGVNTSPADSQAVVGVNRFISTFNLFGPQTGLKGGGYLSADVFLSCDQAGQGNFGCLLPMDYSHFNAEANKIETGLCLKGGPIGNDRADLLPNNGIGKNPIEGIISLDPTCTDQLYVRVGTPDAPVDNKVNGSVNVSGNVTTRSTRVPAGTLQLNALPGDLITMVNDPQRGLVYSPVSADTQVILGVLNADGTFTNGGEADIRLDNTGNPGDLVQISATGPGQGHAVGPNMTASGKVVGAVDHQNPDGSYRVKLVFAYQSVASLTGITAGTGINIAAGAQPTISLNQAYLDTGYAGLLHRNTFTDQNTFLGPVTASAGINASNVSASGAIAATGGDFGTLTTNGFSGNFGNFKTFTVGDGQTNIVEAGSGFFGVTVVPSGTYFVRVRKTNSSTDYLNAIQVNGTTQRTSFNTPVDVEAPLSVSSGGPFTLLPVSNDPTQPSDSAKVSFNSTDGSTTYKWDLNAKSSGAFNLSTTANNGTPNVALGIDPNGVTQVGDISVRGISQSFAFVRGGPVAPNQVVKLVGSPPYEAVQLASSADVGNILGIIARVNAPITSGDTSIVDVVKYGKAIVRVDNPANAKPGDWMVAADYPGLAHGTGNASRPTSGAPLGPILATPTEDPSLPLGTVRIELGGPFQIAGGSGGSSTTSATSPLNAITTGNNTTISLTGMVQVANGGTGLSTAAGAGQFLAGNGAGGYATRSLAAGDLPPNATFVNVATQTFVSTSAATLGQATVNGPLTVNGPTILNGQLSKPAGSFRIDHPLDPEHKYLYHSFVESPDMMNIYNGVVRLDARGRAWVTLPEWFEALNREFRYQLTAIGAPGPNLHIAEEITGNRFKIAGGRAGSKVSWQVTGIRHDKYANEHRIPVEEEKPSAEQ